MVLILLLIYICARDLRSHTISNCSILALSGIMYLSFGHEVRFLFGLLTFLGLIVVGIRLSLGGGDIKLITSLVLFANINLGLSDYLGISLVVGVTHLLINYWRKGRISGNIALAPTICSPLLFSLF